MEVRVGKMPGRIESYALDQGATVGSALSVAGLDSEGFTIKVNNEIANSDKVLNDGDLILLVQQVKGN